MKFWEAMKALQDGYKVRRKDWKPVDHYFELLTTGDQVCLVNKDRCMPVTFDFTDDDFSAVWQLYNIDVPEDALNDLLVKTRLDELEIRVKTLERVIHANK